MSDPDQADQAAQLLAKVTGPDRESGLRLDRHGQWSHRGTPVTHHRLSRALTRWIDRADDGRFVVRVGPDFWAYIEVEDAPFQAAVTAVDEAGLHLALSDDTGEIQDRGEILVGEDEAWYVVVKEGRFEALLTRGAQAHLGEYVEEDPSAPAGYCLSLPAGRRLPFAPR